MVIYPYSFPALIALSVKGVLLYYSQRMRVWTQSGYLQKKVFSLAVLVAITLNVTEFIILQHPFLNSTYYGGIAFHLLSVILVALLIHLAISISIDQWQARRLRPLYFALYGYALILDILLVFTHWIIIDIGIFKGYTMTAIRGPWYSLYELFIFLGVLSFLVLPAWGLRTTTNPARRRQCKLWIVSAAPVVLAVALIQILLRLKIYLFNATVTTPLLVMLLMLATGHAIYHNRIIDPEFYIPWSKLRKSKIALHQQVRALANEVEKVPCLQTLVDYLANSLQCPVSLISMRGQQFTQGSTDIAGPPITALRKIKSMLVATEITNTVPRTHTLMKKHHVAVIVPFYPHNQRVASWLLLGEPFGQHVYTPQDFRVVEYLFDKIAIVLLDKLLEIKAKVSVVTEIKAMEECHRETKERLGTLAFRPAGEGTSKAGKPLEEYVMESEIRLIKQALDECGGNKAAAARHLGLKPNTFHYKLKRLGLMQ